MKCNLAPWDRILRIIFGVLLTIYAVIGGPFWSYFGIYLIISASWGFCLIYLFFNIKTFRFPVNKKKSLESRQ